MRFPDALTMAFSGCKITRAAWGTPDKYVYFDAEKIRVRYSTTSTKLSRGRLDWNFYPIQADLIATDWEIAR